MKQFLMISVLFIIIFILCLVNIHVVSNITGSVASLLDESEYYADTGDWEHAREASLEAFYKWHSSHNYLSVVINHAQIDQITTEFMSMLEYVYIQDAPEFKSKNAIVISLLENISSSENISITNIL